MRVLLIEVDPPQEWAAALDTLAAELETSEGWTLVRAGAEQWSRGTIADVYLVSAGSSDAYEPLLSKRHAIDPRSLTRTVLLGANLPWELGAIDHPAGSLPHLLETYGLAGAFTGGALVRWREAPSSFAGPKALMESLGTNCMKAAQSDRYCFWFAAPGETLAAFLATYLKVLCASSP